MENLCNFGEISSSAIEDKHSSSNDIFWQTKKLDEMKSVQFSVPENLGNYNSIESLCSNFGFFQNDPSQEQELLLSTNQQKFHHHQQLYQDYETFDNLQFDMVQFDEQCETKKFPLGDTKKEKQYYQKTPLAAPVEILKNYGKGFKRLLPDEGKILHPVNDFGLVKDHENERKLSTADIMKIAGTRFIQSSSSSESSSGLILNHPFGFSFSGLTDEEKEDISLAESLLACAEKVGNQQFERARKLVPYIESLSSNSGNPVKRVVYYFVEALRQRIDKETGRVSINNDMQKCLFDPEEETKGTNPTLVAFFEDLPFSKISMFTCVQALIENVTDAKKIHVIDLEIRKGSHWTILMLALQSRNECPLEVLKITAIASGNTDTLKHIIEDTGKRLKDFAQSLNIPFLFDIVFVTDLLHLTEDNFKIDSDETVAVYAQYALRSKIQQSDQLETVMRVIRTINPIVMVVAETEANHNSKSFVNRFIESLFFFSAFFDCLEDCMKGDEKNRTIIESMYFSHGIRNNVAEEGAERKSRDVKIDVWRAFFTRFGMVETELSMKALYQAELVAKGFPCGNSCTFDMNGHCLIVGWKGTPINSISAWKFI